jgi:hypothetical protein
MPARGEIFMISSDGKAKRVPVNDFPVQGRYGRGVIAWVLPRTVKLAGIATGKPNAVATVHLLKAAPKSTRLDAAPVRKRSAVRGDAVVEVKPGDAVQSVVMGWEVENYVAVSEKKDAKQALGKKRPAAKKPSARKTAARKTAATSSANGKGPATSSSTDGKKPVAKKPTPKAKPIAQKPATTKSKPAKSTPKGKKPTRRKTTKK